MSGLVEPCKDDRNFVPFDAVPTTSRCPSSASADWFSMDRHRMELEEAADDVVGISPLGKCAMVQSDMRLSETRSEIVNEKVSEKMSEKMSEKVSEKMGEKVSEKTSEKMSEKMSEKRSKKLNEKECEKKSEKMNGEYSNDYLHYADHLQDADSAGMCEKQCSVENHVNEILSCKSLRLEAFPSTHEVSRQEELTLSTESHTENISDVTKCTRASSSSSLEDGESCACQADMVNADQTYEVCRSHNGYFARKERCIRKDFCRTSELDGGFLDRLSMNTADDTLERLILDSTIKMHDKEMLGIRCAVGLCLSNTKDVVVKKENATIEGFGINESKNSLVERISYQIEPNHTAASGVPMFSNIPSSSSHFSDTSSSMNSFVKREASDQKFEAILNSTTGDPAFLRNSSHATAKQTGEVLDIFHADNNTGYPTQEVSTHFIDFQSDLPEIPSLRGGVATIGAGGGKMLKCPRCNWHYKYQETLEIHVREKHDVTSSQSRCAYCLEGAAHPRLSRGESHACGYKPYHCAACAYSTTTKGNLNIHMQSDRHLSNVGELQGTMGVAGTPPTGGASCSPPQSPSSSSPADFADSAECALRKVQFAQSVRKASWRCDMCAYETNVARNLRIHMTSEKHAQNALAQWRQGPPRPFDALENGTGLRQSGGSLGRWFCGGGGGFTTSGSAVGDCQSSANEAVAVSSGCDDLVNFNLASVVNTNRAKATVASTNIQMRTQSLSQCTGMFDKTKDSPPIPNPFYNHSAVDVKYTSETRNSFRYHLDAEAANKSSNSLPNPGREFLFRCKICDRFASDSLSAMSAHESLDRTQIGGAELDGVFFANGTHSCSLCGYRTTLRANFQLHCKTDKHLQRVQFVNHVREGGAVSEWRHLTGSSGGSGGGFGGIGIRCSACDFVASNVQKMQMHVSEREHAVNVCAGAAMAGKTAQMYADAEKNRGGFCPQALAEKNLEDFDVTKGLLVERGVEDEDRLGWIRQRNGLAKCVEDRKGDLGENKRVESRSADAFGRNNFVNGDPRTPPDSTPPEATRTSCELCQTTCETSDDLKRHLSRDHDVKTDFLHFLSFHSDLKDFGTTAKDQSCAIGLGDEVNEYSTRQLDLLEARATELADLATAEALNCNGTTSEIRHQFNPVSCSESESVESQTRRRSEQSSRHPNKSLIESDVTHTTKIQEENLGKHTAESSTESPTNRGSQECKESDRERCGVHVYSCETEDETECKNGNRNTSEQRETDDNTDTVRITDDATTDDTTDGTRDSKTYCTTDGNTGGATSGTADGNTNGTTNIATDGTADSTTGGTINVATCDTTETPEQSRSCGTADLRPCYPSPSSLAEFASSTLTSHNSHSSCTKPTIAPLVHDVKKVDKDTEVPNDTCANITHAEQCASDSPPIAKVEQACDDCRMRFVSLSLLKNHGLRHAVARAKRCAVCDLKCESLAEIVRHLKKVHGRIDEEFGRKIAFIRNLVEEEEKLECSRKSELKEYDSVENGFFNEMKRTTILGRTERNREPSADSGLFKNDSSSVNKLMRQPSFTPISNTDVVEVKKFPSFVYHGATDNPAEANLLNGRSPRVGKDHANNDICEREGTPEGFDDQFKCNACFKSFQQKSMLIEHFCFSPKKESKACGSPVGYHNSDVNAKMQKLEAIAKSTPIFKESLITAVASDEQRNGRKSGAKCSEKTCDILSPELCSSSELADAMPHAENGHYHALLMEIGIDWVTRYNESHRHRKRRKRLRATSELDQTDDAMKDSDEIEKRNEKMPRTGCNLDPDGTCAYRCCNEDFSSVRQLKAHREVAHADRSFIEHVEKLNADCKPNLNGQLHQQQNHHLLLQQTQQQFHQQLQQQQMQSLQQLLFSQRHQPRHKQFQQELPEDTEAMSTSTKSTPTLSTILDSSIIKNQPSFNSILTQNISKDLLSQAMQQMAMPMPPFQGFSAEQGFSLGAFPPAAAASAYLSFLRLMIPALGGMDAYTMAGLMGMGMLDPGWMLGSLPHTGTSSMGLSSIEVPSSMGVQAIPFLGQMFQQKDDVTKQSQWSQEITSLQASERNKIQGSNSLSEKEDFSCLHREIGYPYLHIQQAMQQSQRLTSEQNQFTMDAKDQFSFVQNTLHRNFAPNHPLENDMSALSDHHLPQPRDHQQDHGQFATKRRNHYDPQSVRNKIDPPKRARTRINEGQLAVLRAHFDLFNSPNDEQIDAMARKTDLPPKVIKHWFRNTLFKERQRNKDSPYNFSVPPDSGGTDGGTSAEKKNVDAVDAVEERKPKIEQCGENLDISIFEAAGQENIAVQKLLEIRAENIDVKKEVESAIDTVVMMPCEFAEKIQSSMLNLKSPRTSAVVNIAIECSSPNGIGGCNGFSNLKTQERHSLEVQEEAGLGSKESRHDITGTGKCIDFDHAKNVICSGEPSKPSSNNLAEFSHLGPGNYSLAENVTAPPQSLYRSDFKFLSYPSDVSLTFPQIVNRGSENAARYADDAERTRATGRGGGKSNFRKSGSGSGGSSSSSGRRANRTHFSEQQVRVLQQHFDMNAYPKDDELEALSNLLDLGPRVIIVWFQNARQKARKSYENQTSSIGDQMGFATEQSASKSTDQNEIRSANQSFDPCVDRSGIVDQYSYRSMNQQHSTGHRSTQSFNRIQTAANRYSRITESMPSQQMEIQTASEFYQKNYDTKYNSPSSARYSCKECPATFERYYDLITHQASHATHASTGVHGSANTTVDARIKSASLQESAAFGATSNAKPIDDANSTITSSQLIQFNMRPFSASESSNSSESLTRSTYPTDSDANASVSGRCPVSQSEASKFHAAAIRDPAPWNPFPPTTRDSSEDAQPSKHSFSAFEFLQAAATIQHPQGATKAKKIPLVTPSIKIPFVETPFVETGEFDSAGTQKDRRVRTTILPDQLEYLNEKYSADSNPSRKQLNAIAAEVQLKKRVVQVWFQNTRARERKSAAPRVLNGVSGGGGEDCGMGVGGGEARHDGCCVFCQAEFDNDEALDVHISVKHPRETRRFGKDVQKTSKNPHDFTKETACNFRNKFSDFYEGAVDQSKQSPKIANMESDRSSFSLGNNFMFAGARPICIGRKDAPKSDPESGLMGLLSNPYNMPMPFPPLVPANSEFIRAASNVSDSDFASAFHESSLRQYMSSLVEVRGGFSGFFPTRTTDGFSSSIGSDNGLDCPLDLSRPDRIDNDLMSKERQSSCLPQMMNHSGENNEGKIDILTTSKSQYFGIAEGRSLTKNLVGSGDYKWGELPKDKKAKELETVDQKLHEMPTSQQQNSQQHLDDHHQQQQQQDSKQQQKKQHLDQQQQQQQQDQQQATKRHRTHMSSLQIRAMKSIYAIYRTPTIAECDTLGRDIGLRKRVVQVWFQNARAKDKKIRLSAAEESGCSAAEATSSETTASGSEECSYCGVRYSAELPMREHLFGRAHLDAIKRHLRGFERGKGNGSRVEGGERSSGSRRGRREGGYEDGVVGGGSGGVVVDATCRAKPCGLALTQEMSSGSASLSIPIQATVPSRGPPVPGFALGSAIPFLYSPAGLGAFHPGMCVSTPSPLFTSQVATPLVSGLHSGGAAANASLPSRYSSALSFPHLLSSSPLSDRPTSAEFQCGAMQTTPGYDRHVPASSNPDDLSSTDKDH